MRSDAPRRDETERSRAPISSALLVLPILLILPAAPARPATRNVCGLCAYTSIQGAIDAAAAGDLIRVLDPTHTESEILVNEDVTIEGLGMNATIVQAGLVLADGNGRVFTFGSGVSATLHKMTIRHGDHPSIGGGLHHAGDALHLEDVRIVNNRARTGGGISVGQDSTLVLLRCEVVDNEAIDSSPTLPTAIGGGISSSGDLRVAQTLIAGNSAVVGASGIDPGSASAGGIRSAGTLVLIASSIEENLVDGPGALSASGGGIVAGGWAYIGRTRIANNLVQSGGGNGGGIFLTSGRLVLTDSVVSGNSATNAGGLFLGGAEEIDLIRSSIHDNATSGLGGGIFAGGEDIELANVTVSGNLANSHGGGIYVSHVATLRLASTTIAFNQADADDNDSGSGGGLYLATSGDDSGTVALRNTLIANNTASFTVFFRAPDCAGTLISDGYNVIGTLGFAGLNPAPCKTVGSSNGLQTGLTVALDPLALYGGSTPSHRLPVGSPAINAGNPSVCLDYDGVPLAVDQRFAERNGICDVGAFERGFAPGVFFDGFESGTALAWSSSAP